MPSRRDLVFSRGLIEKILIRGQGETAGVEFIARSVGYRCGAKPPRSAKMTVKMTAVAVSLPWSTSATTTLIVPWLYCVF
jgi:hypothetical protein